MKYITHHRYKELALCGKQLNIPYGTELNAINNFITTLDGKTICHQECENAKLHFARNDDGKGLERGTLTYAIAYGKREKKNSDGTISRFSDEERKILKRDWSHFLRTDSDFILFNEEFFMADINELRKLADSLGMKL